MKSKMQRVTKLSFLLLGALPASAMPADVQYSPAESEIYIKAGEGAWAESLVHGDPILVKRILADDFVGVEDGALYDKTSAVADAGKDSGDYLSNHVDYARVRFFGDTAVVQGSETWTRKGGVKGHHVWIDTWVYQNGQWQIVAADDTTVTKK